jgi:hypothetical protein
VVEHRDWGDGVSDAMLMVGRATKIKLKDRKTKKNMDKSHKRKRDRSFQIDRLMRWIMLHKKQKKSLDNTLYIKGEAQINKGKTKNHKPVYQGWWKKHHKEGRGSSLIHRAACKGITHKLLYRV